MQELIADSQVQDEKGIYEFILGGEKDYALLNIRVFDVRVKKLFIKIKQIRLENLGYLIVLCVPPQQIITRNVYKQSEMEADHITAWSKGGNTDLSNCEMLCKTHDRAKGNS